MPVVRLLVPLVALLFAACGSLEEPAEALAAPTPASGTVTTDRTATPSAEPTRVATPAATAPLSPEAGSVPVVNVVDGDTIDVLLQGETRRVRLILVDTPEVHGRTDCFGREASEFVKALLPEGTPVVLERDVSETDRFGRLLRYVYLPDGRMLNELLLSEGYAQVATFPPDIRYVDRFRELQAEARDAERGLWAA